MLPVLRVIETINDSSDVSCLTLPLLYWQGIRNMITESINNIPT